MPQIPDLPPAPASHTAQIIRLLRDQEMREQVAAEAYHAMKARAEAAENLAAIREKALSEAQRRADIAEARLDCRISDDWERLHIEIVGHSLDLSRDQVADLHSATGEALGLLAQSITTRTP